MSAKYEARVILRRIRAIAIARQQYILRADIIYSHRASRYGENIVNVRVRDLSSSRECVARE